MEIKWNFKDFLKKRGIIFSLDAAIAVTIVIILLVNSQYYFSTASKESASQLQLARMGGDVLAILDSTGTLDRIALLEQPESGAAQQSLLNVTTLNYSTYLPRNYNMKILITDLDESGTNIDSIPENPKCDPIGCKFDSSDDSINTSTRDILRERDFFLQASVKPLSVGSHTLRAQLSSAFQDLTFTKEGIYYFPQKFHFTLLKNSINFSHQGGNFYLKWFRVMGASAYSLETPGEIPIDRFVGTGARVFFVANNTYNNSVHVARFWTWLK